MIIQPPFGGCLRLLIAIAPHRYASMARCIAIPKTAEERLYTLARGWIAYPVTPMRTHHYRRRAVVYVSTGLACLPRDIDAFATTAEERLYKHTEANALQTGSPPKTKFPTAKPQPETV